MGTVRTIVDSTVRGHCRQILADFGSENVDTCESPPDNTYQAPGVKRAHDFYDVGFGRLVGFRLGSVVGL